MSYMGMVELNGGRDDSWGGLLGAARVIGSRGKVTKRKIIVWLAEGGKGSSVGSTGGGGGGGGGSGGVGRGGGGGGLG